MAIASNFPSSRPSLLLDFANVGRLDPRVTFTRASSGTYYDGVTTAKAEENLVLQSQDFTTTWSSLRAVLTGSQTAPDGTSTAFKFQSASGETDAPVVTQTVTVSSGLEYVISIHAKAGDRNFIRVAELIQTGSSVNSGFDLSTGTVAATGSGHTNSIVDVGGGWYRCIVKVTVNANRSAAVQFRATESASSNVVPDNQGYIDIWGAQLEQRSAVTAYTATTTQPVTNYIPVLQTAAAGVPRFEHTPTTGVADGLFIEEQRTNLLTYSEDFSDSDWTKTNSSITSNTIVAPDATLTGDKLVENTSTSTHGVSQDATVVDATTYTFSCYAKLGERTKFRIRFGTSGGGGSFLGSADFDLSAGTVDSSSITSASITAVGNGWYRCVATDVSSGTTLGCAIFLIETGTTTSYTGDGYSGIYIWGAQLEAGAFPTSYISTTSASATRNADAASMTGTNFSDWYNAGEGTLFVEFSFIGLSSVSGQRIAVIDDGSTNNYFGLVATGSNTMQNPVVVSGSTEAANSTPSTTYSANTIYKQAIGLEFNNSVGAISGVAGNVDTSVSVPSGLTTLRFAGSSAGINSNIKFRRLTYYPQRLTDAQLQALTG